MKKKPKPPETVDEYIQACAPEVRGVLRKVRATIKEAAPEGDEVISYQMPALKQQGIVVYYAAWKKHIGLYPPVNGDARLEKAVEPYAGEKGNLQFPLDKPIPYALIARIVKHRLKQNAARAKARKKKRG